MSEIPEAVWAELDNVFQHQFRQVGDIDAVQMAKRYGITHNAARSKMARLAERYPDQWLFLKVRDLEYHRDINVIRQVKKSAPPA